VTLPPDVVVGEEITVLIDGQHIDIVAPDYVGEVVVAIPIETSEGFGTVVRSGDSSTATEALLSDAPAQALAANFVSPSSSSLSCSACTFQNTAGQAQCTMCGTQLPTNAGLPIADTVFGRSI
jgi:uncharacterized paraquat-inducible protein A